MTSAPPAAYTVLLSVSLHTSAPGQASVASASAFLGRALIAAVSMVVPSAGIALVPCLFHMTLQLFFGITPAPPDSVHLLDRWQPAMTILIMAVLRLPVPGKLRGVLVLLLTHNGIVPPGNRPREDRFLPGKQRAPPRRAQALAKETFTCDHAA